MDWRNGIDSNSQETKKENRQAGSLWTIVSNVLTVLCLDMWRWHVWAMVLGNHQVRWTTWEIGMENLSRGPEKAHHSKVYRCVFYPKPGIWEQHNLARYWRTHQTLENSLLVLNKDRSRKQSDNNINKYAIFSKTMLWWKHKNVFLVNSVYISVENWNFPVFVSL